MSDYGLDENGLKIKRLPDIKDEIEDDYRNIAGNDVNLDPQSTQGQEVAIWSNSISDFWQELENLYNSFDPNAAFGIPLDRLVAINGIKRKPATYSTSVITITGTSGTIIPAGSSVASSLTQGKIFTSLEDVTIPISGTLDNIFQSNEIGEITAPAGSLNIIETPVLGWSSAINNADASLGSDNETDSALRFRRAQSTALAATNIIDSLYSALFSINSVLDAVIFNNPTNVTSPEGVPAHRYMPIIDGGLDDEIANAIYLNHTTGDKSFGSVIVPYLNSRGQQINVEFERPIDVDIYVELTISTTSQFPSDGEDQIKQAIVDYGRGEFTQDNCDDGFKISEDVIYSRLFTPINSVCGHDVVQLLIGTTPSPALTGNIPINFNEISRWDVSRIEIIIA
jgi:uncharacterized phage protein gp47/JayE